MIVPFIGNQILSPLRVELTIWSQMPRGIAHREREKYGHFIRWIEMRMPERIPYLNLGGNSLYAVVDLWKYFYNVN